MDWLPDEKTGIFGAILLLIGAFFKFLPEWRSQDTDQLKLKISADQAPQLQFYKDLVQQAGNEQSRADQLAQDLMKQAVDAARARERVHYLESLLDQAGVQYAREQDQDNPPERSSSRSEQSPDEENAEDSEGDSGEDEPP